MFKRRRPTGRESAIAGAALTALQGRPSGDPGIAALATIAPAANWLGDGKRAIRLINLERRARFSRPLTDFA